MTRRLLAATILVVVVIASTCAPRNDASAEETVRAWLLCDECSDDELGKVIALGSSAIPLLADALGAGPNGAQRANVRRQIESDAAAANRFSKTVGVLAVDTGGGYFDRYVESYVATYKERAFIALKSLNDTAAVKLALDSLAARDLVTAFGWNPPLKAAVHGHSTRVTLVDILNIDPLIVGQTRLVRVKVEGGDETTPLTWTSEDATVATVSSARIVTGLKAGMTTVEACWIPPEVGGEPVCDVAAVTVKN